MFLACFSGEEQLLLAVALLAVLSACCAHVKNLDRSALLLLIVAAFALRLFAALLDPFLNTWDECFHALVAKNMILGPLKPMLFREDALVGDKGTWTRNHVWLHKPPFFLWSMAAWIKVLGPTAFAARVSSVLFGSALVFFTHGIAKAMHGRHVAFVAALFCACSYWLLTLVMGQSMTDHNDAHFIALVGGSLWAWYALPATGRARIIWTGVLAGLAVLTKWLPGLLVFGGWAVVVIAMQDRRAGWREWSISLLVALAVILPWHLYSWLRFPQEMAHETALNMSHLQHPLEGHGGGAFFHFNALRDLFMPFGPWFIVLLLVLGIALTRSHRLRLHAAFSIASVYLFYTIAATKMTAYPMIVIPFFFIGMAAGLARTVELLKLQQAWILPVLSLLIALPLLQLHRIAITHADGSISDAFYADLRSRQLHDLRAMDALDARLAALPKAVVFNVPFPVNIANTYFHGRETMPGLPSAEQVAQLIGKGYQVVVVDPTATQKMTLTARIHVVHLGKDAFVTVPI